MPVALRYFGTYIGSGEVDVFLLLSGFGLCYSWKKIRDRKAFRLHHMKKILVPYLLFCIPILFAVRVILSHEGILQFIKDAFFLSFITDGYRLFWYIPCILFCYLLFPCICEALDLDGNPVGRRLRLVLVAGAVFLLADVLTLSFTGFMDKTSIMLLRIPSFIGGVYLGIRSQNNERLGGEGLAWLLGLAAASHYVCAKGALPLLGRPAMAVCTLFWLLLTVLLIEKVPEKLRKSLPGRFLRSCVSWCGERTLEFYLVHVGIREIMKKSGFSTGRYMVYFLIMVLSIPVSALLHRLSGRVLKMLQDSRPQAA
jgi:peptidoglycan/LPS O-acetylase OafA/YrhL